jgi:uncharacterized small protein (DUF1192 family)
VVQKRHSARKPSIAWCEYASSTAVGCRISGICDLAPEQSPSLLGLAQPCAMSTQLRQLTHRRRKWDAKDDASMAEKWLTMAQACDTLGKSETTVRRYIKQGKIKSRLENGRRLVLVTSEPEQRQDNTDMTQLVLIEQLLSGIQDLHQHVTDLQNELKRREAQTQRRNWASFWHKSDTHIGQSALIEQLLSEVQHLRQHIRHLEDELGRRDAQAEREKWASFWHR